MMHNSGAKCWNSLNQPVLHGEYFTPNAKDICKKCKCLAGQAMGCFFEKCPQLPGCDRYKQVEGTCCEFECLQGNGLSGKTEFAVLFSLSTGLVVLLIILFLVLYCQHQRIKKSKKQSEMTKTQSATEQSQSTTACSPGVITHQLKQLHKVILSCHHHTQQSRAVVL
ncbi:integral membrane protein DGCR2/IDD-like [Dendronephthya gigantea]|uniref:integral membrane protein DGCR2/IDD-like n=1 Tax=Dendronephthya gigantea TaxID=151771 RepID=UPI00106D2914|nr:integral membrane protein DGCR2/IDD-like [Dendronephthya gigantea]